MGEKATAGCVSSKGRVSQVPHKGGGDGGLKFEASGEGDRIFLVLRFRV